MERAWLERELASGRSIESIAREVGKHPSTIAYWVKKHGLHSAHAERHAPRGPIGRDELAALIDRGLSTREIAAALGRSQATIRYWLARHGMRTERTEKPGPEVRAIQRTCRKHGLTTFVRYSGNDHFRCEQCRKERVAARRRRIKEILVGEAGGACHLCGYDRFLGALHFHHVDPSDKEFGLAYRGVARSLQRNRAEAAKCVLLCANCHAEVEAGMAALPCGPSPRLTVVARSVDAG